LEDPPITKARLLLQDGPEPLTDRELGILCLLDKESTIREIARDLVVTTGTVKSRCQPTYNVDRNHSVKNRCAAVTLAQALRSACWLLARPLRLLPADFLIRIVGRCSLASHSRKLYLLYTLWGISFWCVFVYSDTQE
jgi:hypothetical protein